MASSDKGTMATKATKSVTCGACLCLKDSQEFFRKQRNKGKVGRCRDCMRRNTPIDSKLWAESLQEKAEVLEATRRQDEKRRQVKEREMQENERERQENEREIQKRIQFKLDHPVAPAHPDEGKAFTPDQTFEVKSGGFCFGLRHNVQEAAAKPLLSFNEIARKTGDRGGDVICNTVAENGLWHAYRFVSRTDQHGEFRGSWLMCRHGLDPVLEVRQLIYHAVSGVVSGNAILSGIGSSLKHHRKLGYAVYPRYIIGTTYEFSSRKAHNIQGEGGYVVDYEQAQVKGKPATKWTNAIRGMNSGGDFDVAGLSYTKEGQCKAFLFYGNAVDFAEVYFHEGTAPLGQREWPEKCCCPEHGFTDRSISVNEYLQRSKTKLCFNTKTYWEMMGLKPPTPTKKKERKKKAVVAKKSSPKRKKREAPSNSKKNESTTTNTESPTKKKKSEATKEALKGVVLTPQTNVMPPIAEQKKGQQSITQFFKPATK